MKKNIIIWLIFQLFFPTFLSAQLSPPVGPGNTFNFNGSTHFNIGDDVANGTRTIEMWVKLNVPVNSSLSDALTLVVRDYDNGSAVSQNEFGLYFRHAAFGQGGRLTFYRRVGGAANEILSDQNSWNANVWYHIAGVIHPQNGMMLFINGVLQQATNSSTSAIGTQTGSSTDETCIGRWGQYMRPNGIRYFNGQIDELRFWTTARTQTEIRANMCHKLAGNETGLKAYYRFDEVSGSNLDDLTTGNYDGTAFGTVAWRTSGAPVGDASTTIYNDNIPWTGWANTQLKLDVPSGDTLILASPSGNPDGLHIYRIGSDPSSVSGLDDCFPNWYFGAFVAHDNDTTFDYDLTYRYQVGNGLITLVNEPTLGLYKRKHNAIPSWGDANATLTVATDNLTRQNESYRAEYIFQIVDEPIDLGNDTTVCQGVTIRLDAGPASAGVSYVWQNGATGPILQASLPGLYSVTRTGPCGISRDTIRIDIEPLPQANLGPDTVICQGGSLLLSAPGSQVSYLWQDGSSLPSYTATSSGVYWVELTNACGTDRDSIQIDFLLPPMVQLGADTVLCQGDSVILSAASLQATYLWQNGNGSATFKAKNTGIYWVEVVNACGMDRDSISLTFLPPPTPNLGADTALCIGDVLLLSPSLTGVSYTWQDGSTQPNFLVQTPGQYWVVTDSMGCVGRDSVTISYIPPLTLNLRDTTICVGEQLVVNAANAQATYLWQDGSTNSVFSIVGPGLYWVEVANPCDTIRDSLTVAFFPAIPSVFGPDTTLCHGDSLVLRATTAGATYLWQDGSLADTLLVRSSGTYSVTIQRGCIRNDTLVATFLPIPQIDLGPSMELCEGDSIRLGRSVLGATYRWQDGSTDSIFWATSTGVFWVEIANACGMATDTVSLNFYPEPTVDLGSDLALCEGDEVVLNAFFPQAAYQWQDGSRESTFTVTAQGLYWVIVKNGCREVVDSLLATFGTIPQLTLPADTTLCEGDSFLLIPTIHSNLAVTFLWQDSSDLPSYPIDTAGTYSLQIENRCGTDMDEITVAWNVIPAPNLGEDTLLCEGEMLFLNAHAQYTQQYIWQDGQEDSLYQIYEPGLYILRTRNQCGLGIDSLLVEYDPCDCRVFMANAFTPNDDGHNEEIGPIYDCRFESFTYQIFNRWGNLIYETSNPDAHWDGRFKGVSCPEGVYVWVINYRGWQTRKIVSGKLRGSLTLFR